MRFFTAVTLAVFLVSCGKPSLNTKPDVSAAVGYKWVGKQTKNTDRKVTEAWLYIPKEEGLHAKDEASRAKARMHTTLKAALDLHAEQNPDCVVTYLVEENNKAFIGDPMAARIKAVYAPDGGGVTGRDKLINGTFGVAVRAGEAVSQ